MVDRKKRFIKNTYIGILKQITTVVCGFIVPRYILMYYGSSLNGLISSITSFLSCISILDLGVGAVVQANLYKPLADRNEYEVVQLIKSSERFFRHLAMAFLAYIVFLCIILPGVNSNFDYLYTVTLIIIIAISTLVQYLFGITYEILLNADQKSYVHLALRIGTTLLNAVVSIVLIQNGVGIHIVKFVSALVYVLRPIVQFIYVKKNYLLNLDIKLVGEPIKQKWNGFSQHLAAVICQNVDVVVLTLVSTLENVSIYHVYFSVVLGVQELILTTATGVESLFGNMISKGEQKELVDVFSKVEWGMHNIVSVVFTITAITITPFISVYTRGVNDVNYIIPEFGKMLTCAYGVLCLRVPYFRVIKAARHFKETQNGAYISALINILSTLLLVFKLGLIGAAIGTFLALFYHTIYFVWYLKDHIINRSPLYFIKNTMIDVLVACISLLLLSDVPSSISSYTEWILIALRVTGYVVLIDVAVNILFNRKMIKKCYEDKIWSR